MRKSSLLLISAAIVCATTFAQAPTSQPVLPPNEPRNLNDLQTIVSLDKVWFQDDSARLAADQSHLADYEKQMVAYHDCTDPKICYTADIEKQTDQAIAYLERGGALSETMARARAFAAKARDTLRGCPQGPILNVLADIADFVVERAY